MEIVCDTERPICKPSIKLTPSSECNTPNGNETPPTFDQDTPTSQPSDDAVDGDESLSSESREKSRETAGNGDDDETTPTESQTTPTSSQTKPHALELSSPIVEEPKVMDSGYNSASIIIYSVLIYCNKCNPIYININYNYKNKS